MINSLVGKMNYSLETHLDHLLMHSAQNMVYVWKVLKNSFTYTKIHLHTNAYSSVTFAMKISKSKKNKTGPDLNICRNGKNYSRKSEAAKCLQQNFALKQKWQNFAAKFLQLHTCNLNIIQQNQNVTMKNSTGLVGRLDGYSFLMHYCPLLYVNYY